MTVALIFLLVLLVLALLIVPFARDMVKDKLELQKVTLEKKFEVLIEHINQGLFFGEAEVTVFDDDPRSLNIFSDNHANRIVRFMYSTGHLTIEMGYKYFQKELVFNKCYHNLRNITIFEQKNIARDFIETAQFRISQHERSVNAVTIDGISSAAGISSDVSIDKDPTKLFDDFYAELSREQKMSMINHMAIIDYAWRQDFKESYKLSIIQQSMILMNVREDECQSLLRQKGEDYIYKTLEDLPEVYMDSHLYHCLQVFLEFKGEEEAGERAYAKLWGSFSHMGISEEEARSRIGKVIALNKMFGI